MNEVDAFWENLKRSTVAKKYRYQNKEDGVRKVHVKELRRDIFVLIIGYGRTGTSLCVGLLNGSSHFNIGYEVNNQWVHCEENIDLGFSSSFRKTVIPNEYNGNKIVINEKSSIQYIKAFCKNRFCIMHDNFKELKVIFTERQMVNTIISKYKRVSEKREGVLVENIAKEYIIAMKKVKKLKEVFKDHYIFNFEMVLEDNSRIAGLFDFVGEEFFESYASNYIGVGNYNHARGVNDGNVLFGRKDLFPKMRDKVRKILVKEGLM